MKYIHVNTKVESRIAALDKAGKSGTALVKKANSIIESLASGAFQHHMNAIGSYTKYGEKRIKNCRKYDLGCGYRLITLQRESTIFIPFFGAHDECQRWLENNSKLKAFNAGKGRTIRVAEKKPSPINLKNDEKTDIDAGDDDFLQNLNDEDLRRTFSGLVEGTKKQSQ